MRRLLTLLLAAGLVAPLAVPALAQEGTPGDGDAPTEDPAGALPPAPPPAFEPQLVRLMEVLGSIEVLRGLCGNETGEWRQRASAIIEAEGSVSEPFRRRMIAAYNRGNRAFGAYTACTPSAIYAIERYMDEGETIARDVLVRYGD